MTLYRVWFERTDSGFIEVEATDEEEAIDTAYDEGLPGLCASCAGAFRGEGWSVDAGEWELSESEGVEVVDE